MKKTIGILLLTVCALLCQTSCSKDHPAHHGPVKTYVIVPGSWSAPYAWEAVKEMLEWEGQKVKVVQLPGHGTDQSTVYSSLTLDKYRDYVVSVIDSLHTKVILVGHSMAGMVISQVAEKIPGSIEKMIYVGAYLPVSGQSLLDLALSDTISLLGPALRYNASFDTLDIDHSKIIDIFLQDGSPEVKQLLLANYKVEPGKPFLDKASLSDKNYGRVNKYYIHTLQDHLIPISLQNKMVAASGITRVYQINSSHSPFMSKPDLLEALLQKIVSQQ